jgi:outer membrane protein OmpA-like peptidoglycan-associated protein
MAIVKLATVAISVLLMQLCTQVPNAQVQDMKDQAFTADDVKRALAPPANANTAPSGGPNSSNVVNGAPRRTRGLGVVAAGTAAASAAVAESAPRKLSMQLQFDFNSSDITESARARLDAVGSALQSPELAAGKFIVSGHTDATGRYDYNLGLSKRRAEAVKNYLVTNHGISASRIVPVGKASDELLDPSDPNSPANRRVQLETLN